MASRTRTRFVRYGGEVCGKQSNIALPLRIPAKDGIRSCVDEVHHGPPYRTGGPLLVKKKKFNIQRFSPFNAAQGPVSWSGFLSATTYVPSPEPTPQSLAGWGAKGWNRTVPTHPVYQLGVSLIELKDFPRMIHQSWNLFHSLRGFNFSKVSTTVGGFLSDMRKGSKFMSEHYLNMQFGWAPALQDLAFLLDYQNALRKKLRWLARHNGKSVRRKVTLDQGGFSESVGRFTNRPGTLSPLIDTRFYADSSLSFALPVRKDYKTKIWYSAKYRYWIPEIAKTYLNASDGLKRKLTGLDLDPTTLYKAFPWSWLVDWFSSVGAVVQNLFNMAKFGVIAEYAYVMGSEDYTYDAPAECDVYRGTYNFSTLSWPGKLTLRGSSQTIYEFRQREAASPFGFGLTLASLSAFQWSILVSLGLSTRLR